MEKIEGEEEESVQVLNEVEENEEEESEGHKATKTKYIRRSWKRASRPNS